jgi:hypothetical protein
MRFMRGRELSHPRQAGGDPRRILWIVAEGAKTTWTDDRLDDFRSDVGRRFDRVDHSLDRMDQRIDGLHRTILTVGGGMMASVLIGAAGIAATQL